MQCPAQQLRSQSVQKLPKKNYSRVSDLFVRSCLLDERGPQSTKNSTSATISTKEVHFSLLRDVSGASEG